MNAFQLPNLESMASELSNQHEHHRHLTDVYNLQEFNTGDTSWMMASTALVLLMTMPGLAIYYAGMVRTKNVLATLMQSFTITCLVTIEWLAFGYSLAFGPAETFNTKNVYLLFGSADRTWLFGMDMNVFPNTADDTLTQQYGSYHYLAPTIPEPVFVIYQLMFAIITAALITGSFADRMKFNAMILFILCWHPLVYCPVAHSIFHQDGFLSRYGAIDYAGGNVVHISSGVSGLVAAIYLGHRKGYGKERFDPHNIVLTFMGMAMLWVGWFGFNAGSAYGANYNAGYAMLVTHIATATASLSWMFTDWAVKGTPSTLGMVSGAIAGLVAITPASGYVDQTGAIVIGIVAGPLCFFGAQIKHQCGYDDALDAFGVHAIGGAIGGICTGFFANPDISDETGVYYGTFFSGGRQLACQCYAISCTSAWAAVATYGIIKFVDLTIGARVSEAEEDAGLDSSLHGESLVPSKAFLAPLKEYEMVKENQEVIAAEEAPVSPDA